MLPLALLALFLVCFGELSAASAQENATDDASREKANITERQTKLNEEAVSHIVKGKPELAVALLEESLAYGEANITYLNLGRAYQKLGNCQKARQVYAKVETAPVVEDPPAEVVNLKTAEYLAELDEQDCTAEAQTADKDTTVLPPPQTTAADHTWGWVTLGSGVALLGGGVTMFVLSGAEASKVEDAQTDGRVVDFPAREVPEVERRASLYMNLGVGMSVAGAALAGVGTYLLLDDDHGETVGRVGLQPTAQGARATVELRF